MPTLEEIAKQQRYFLVTSIQEDRDNLLAAIEGLEKRIVDMARKRLETDDAQKLLGPKANLKMAQKLHEDLVREFKKKYEDVVLKTVEGYDEIAAMIRDSWAELGTVVRYTAVDREMMEVLRKGYYDEFTKFGTDAQQKMTRAMYDAVAGQSGFDVLESAISAALTGKVSKNGRPMSTYAAMFANDAIMNFHNAVTMKKAADVGIKTFLYYGNLINTSRPFCIERAGKKYTQEEIDSWTFPWIGKSGPAMTHRGGYNCRHHWMPIHPDWSSKPEPPPAVPEPPKPPPDIKIKISNPTTPEAAAKYMAYLSKKEGELLKLFDNDKYRSIHQRLIEIKLDNDLLKINEDAFAYLKTEFDSMGIDKDASKIVNSVFRVWGEQRKANIIMSTTKVATPAVFQDMMNDIRIGYKTGEFTMEQAIKELEKLASEFIDDSIYWDFTGCDPEAIYSSLAELNEMAKLYPGVMKRLEYIGTYGGNVSNFPVSVKESLNMKIDKFGTNEFAHANYSHGTYIGINPKYYSNYNRLRKSVVSCEASGHHPIGTDRASSIMVHEFGHMVQSELRHKFGTVVEEWEQFFMKGTFVNKKRPKVQSDNPMFLSGYAVKAGRLEPWAEAFAQMWCVKEPSELAYFTMELKRFLTFSKTANYTDMKCLGRIIKSASTKIFGSSPSPTKLAEVFEQAADKLGGTYQEVAKKYMSIRL